MDDSVHIAQQGPPVLWQSGVCVHAVAHSRTVHFVHEIVGRDVASVCKSFVSGNFLGGVFS